MLLAFTRIPLVRRFAVFISLATKFNSNAAINRPPAARTPCHTRYARRIVDSMRCDSIAMVVVSIMSLPHDTPPVICPPAAMVPASGHPGQERLDVT